MSSDDYCNEDSSSAGNLSSDDELLDIPKRRRRKRGSTSGKDENIYGVFANGQDYSASGGGGGGAMSRKRAKSAAAEPVNFVAAAKEEKVGNGGDNEEGDSISADEEDDDDSSGDRDAKFKALLEKATSVNKSTYRPRGRSKQKTEFEAKVEIPFDDKSTNNASDLGGSMSTGLGLGYNTGGGLGMHSQQEGIGLGLGLGFQQEEEEDVNTVKEFKESNYDEAYPQEMGFMKSSFYSQPQRIGTKKPAPGIGKWEKHTKGIGMKLLSKMGFKSGEGLGAERKGISRVVEVKVRPTNLGLGFGDFQEATQLKENKELESELHGKEFKEEETDKPSSISIAEELLEEKNWQKRKPTRTKKWKRQEKKKLIKASYELPSGNGEQIIIDMRGPHEQLNITSKALLGEELLHNISLIVSSAEAKLYSSSHLLSSTTSKMSTIETDIGEIKSRLNMLDQREKRLQKILGALENIELSISNFIQGGKQVKDSDCTEVLMIFANLRSKFGEEYESLNLPDVAPALLGPFMDKSLSSWKPLEHPERLVSMLDSWRPIFIDGHGLSSVFRKFLLPRIRRAILLDWKVSSPTKGVVLYRTMDVALSHADQNSGDVSSIEIRCALSGKEVMEDYILPKLKSSVRQWQPTLDETPIASWLLPWMPHIENKHFDELLKDVQKKLRSALSSGWDAMDDSVFEMLQVWNGIFSDSLMESLVSQTILPELARALSNYRIEIPKANFQLLNNVMKWHESGLLPKHRIESLIEGEVMLNFVTVLYKWLSSDLSVDNCEIAAFYSAFKDTIPTSCLEDITICTYFYSALMMIDSSIQADAKALENLQPPARMTISYRSTLSRRLAEAKTREKLAAGSSSSQQSTRTFYQGFVPGVTRSFREAFEDLCNQNGLLLQPKLGLNATKDGKQVFECGNRNVSMYFDADIIFALQGKEWRPISVDALMMMAK